VVQRVEEKMGILDTGKDARRDEDVILKRKRGRLREMEEFRQREAENEELSKIRRRIKTSKILKELTEKGRQCNEDVVLERKTEESRQQGVEREEDGVVGSSVWAVVQRVEEKKMGTPDLGEDVRCDKDIVLGRKGEGDRLRDT